MKELSIYCNLRGKTLEEALDAVADQIEAVFGQDTLEKKIVRIPEENRQEEKLWTS